MKHFAKILQRLVASNRTKLVLAVLNDFLSRQMPHLHNEALMLQANLTQTERDFTTGVANRNEMQQSLAKVNAGLLHLIEQIGRYTGDETEAIDKAKQIELNFVEQEFVPNTNKWKFIWIFGFSIIILIGFVVWKIVQPFEKPVSQPASSPVQVEKPQKSIAVLKAEYEAWRQQADILSAQGQWDKALEGVNKAFGLGFDDSAIFNQRADILLHLGRFVEARDDARRSITFNANDCLSYMTLAQALSKLGDEEGFYNNIDTALRKHCQVWKYTQQIGIFEYSKTQRFRKLMLQYQ